MTENRQPQDGPAGGNPAPSEHLASSAISGSIGNGGSPPPSFVTALRFWCWLGFISFGGPAGQIGTMHAEVVERRRWVSERRFLHALNYCMVLPGPEATQLAIYIGWLLHGAVGGLAAGILFILPSLILLTGLAWFSVTFGETPAVRAVFWGFKPAVVAVVAAAVLRLGRRSLDSVLSVTLAGFAFVALWSRMLPFPIVLAIAGLSGLAGERFDRAEKSGHDASGPEPATDGEQDESVPPLSRSALLRHAGVAVICWAVPMVVLAVVAGPDATPTHMAWFFTQAALYTFGGAYAVLPFVRDNAISAGWASPEQIIDGLALGETTPGPLIMIVTFIGYVGGWQAWDHGVPGAVLCAVVATYFTFLPSFVFVLLGAPFIERLRGEVRLTALLRGITAAVVGVILSLAVSLAVEVIWPHQRQTDWPAVGMLVGACVCLWKFKFDLIAVVIGCGLLGLLTLARPLFG